MNDRSPDARPALAALLCLILPAVSWGCGATCEELRADYEAAKASEVPDRAAADSESETADAEPAPHFAVALRTGFIETLAGDLVGSAVEGVLTTARQLNVGGSQALQVKALPKIKNFGLDRRKDACPHCFRISGDLGGSLDVTIPVLGDRKVPMSGKVEFVAPLTLGPGAEERSGALYLDVGEAIRETAAPIAINVSGLRDTWARTIEQVLASQVADALVEKIEPIRLFSFKTPDLGIKGFSMTPVGLRIDESGGAVTALFSTSLPLKGQTDPAALARAASPGAKRNLGVAFPVDVVFGAVAHGLRNAGIARRYNLQGESQQEGPVRITLSNFETAAGGQTDAEGEPLDYNFGFKAWHLADSGPCFWFQGLADGAIAIRDNAVEVTLDAVSFKDSSRSNLAVNATNWATAQFLKSGVTVAEKSLDKQNLELPSGKYGFSQLSIRAVDGFLSLSAVAATPDEEADGES